MNIMSAKLKREHKPGRVKAFAKLSEVPYFQAGRPAYTVGESVFGSWPVMGPQGEVTSYDNEAKARNLAEHLNKAFVMGAVAVAEGKLQIPK